MSASLVGSEMCIRDRLSDACCNCARRCGKDACAQMNVWTKVDDLSTVSYTHLTLPTICSV
eukprot:13455967-Alexandrium_andersonii.AAC.1